MAFIRVTVIKVLSPDSTLHSRDFSIRTAEADAGLCHRNSRETPAFQYFYHVSDRSVQCAIGAKNPETTVSYSHTISVGPAAMASGGPAIEFALTHWCFHCVAVLWLTYRDGVSAFHCFTLKASFSWYAFDN